MAIPIRHKTCGQVVMWFVGDRNISAFAEMRSADIAYLDGTRPAYGSACPMCPYCKVPMRPIGLKICFDEDIDPGFDIEEAIQSGNRE